MGMNRTGSSIQEEQRVVMGGRTHLDLPRGMFLSLNILHKEGKFGIAPGQNMAG